MITKKIHDLLSKRDFISIATCDFDSRPNVAPKFFLKMEGKNIFVVDYVLGTTFANLKINPRASASIMDLDNLTGYQINGKVSIIDSGLDHDLLIREFQDKEISLSTKRIIEGIDRGKRHEAFEIEFSEKVVIFKLEIEDVVQIVPSGQRIKEKLEDAS